MKKIGFQILAMIVLTIVLIIGLNIFMRIITYHNQKLTVPNVIHLELEDGIKMLERNNMGYILVDSLFDPNLKPHEIIDQSPKKGSFVKQNRKIYLTINSIQPPIIQLPNLVDMSKRQAQLTLESLGLKMGKEIYQPDIAKDAVLSVRVNGKTASENMAIPKGSVVDLILGDGLGSMDVEIPDLIGLTVMEAMAVLDAVQLSVGQINAQDDVSDQMNAYVYFQQPEYGSTLKVSPGDPVNLYVTKSIPKSIIK
ncbi:MAG: PASTA domain-containing protein [Chitinophagales bacterium]|nr:PASTA domain-containing protein [Chitinophagales bacterium]MCZ2393297.1 PASTA domain-containing protein [Chitinophagales bacterium]